MYVYQEIAAAFNVFVPVEYDVWVNERENREFDLEEGGRKRRHEAEVF